MNWIDEGALFSQISLFLREDLGRGDITTQSIIARNTRARVLRATIDCVVMSPRPRSSRRKSPICE